VPPRALGRRLLALALGATVAVGCSDDAADEASTPASTDEPEASSPSSAGEVSGRRPSTFPGARFVTGRPADHGLEPERVEALDRLAERRGSNCVAVVHDGVLVHEDHWNGTDARTQQEIFSATKSITSFLVGIARDQGLLDIEDPVAD